jgi:hypothetical protein
VTARIAQSKPCAALARRALIENADVGVLERFRD